MRKSYLSLYRSAATLVCVAAVAFLVAGVYVGVSLFFMQDQIRAVVPLIGSALAAGSVAEASGVMAQLVSSIPDAVVSVAQVASISYKGLTIFYFVLAAMGLAAGISAVFTKNKVRAALACFLYIGSAWGIFYAVQKLSYPMSAISAINSKQSLVSVLVTKASVYLAIDLKQALPMIAGILVVSLVGVLIASACAQGEKAAR